MNADFAPLRGVRVLDFSKVLAGPLCTQYLADMGADVIKVEPLGGGDDTRYWPPFDQGRGTIFLSVNRNKRSIALDLKSARGQAVCHRLAATADVVVESFGPGVAERLQVDHAIMARVNPRLVCCSISGFGSIGPLRDGKGYDLVMQAYTGLMSMTGEPGGPPGRSPFSPLDQGTGLHALSGILAALLERQRSGRGTRVEASLFDTAAGFLAYGLQGHWLTGQEPRRVGAAHESLCPYQVFETADRPLVLGIANDALWRAFCAAAAAPQLVDRPGFATNAERVAHRAEVVAAVQALLAERSRDAWMTLLHDRGIPCAPLHTLGEFAATAQLHASRMVFGYPGAANPGAADAGGIDAGAADAPLRGVAQPLRFDGRRRDRHRPAPAYAADTVAVLTEAGYDVAEIDDLLQAEVIADAA
ncbi:MAG: CaiB/BaiF CoA transferase family protein [Lautropia sp.]